MIKKALVPWERGYTGFGWVWGDFSIAPKIEFLRRELTIGHVGIVQKVTKTNKSARLNVHTLSTLAPFFRGRVLRDAPPCAAAPNIPVGRYLD